MAAIVKTAVIIAGGEGTRLRPLTEDKPKTLVEVGGRPLLEWTIMRLQPLDIERLVIGVAYKADRIIEFMDRKKNFGIPVVEYKPHNTSGSTGQAFRHCIKGVVDDDIFLGMHSDDLTNMNIGAMIADHIKNRPILTIGLAPLKVDKGVVTLDGNGMITGFKYGGEMPDKPINMGTYVMSREILDYLPESGSMDETAFPKLASERKARGYLLRKGEEWTSVDAKRDIPVAEDYLRRWGYIR